MAWNALKVIDLHCKYLMSTGKTEYAAKFHFASVFQNL